MCSRCRELGMVLLACLALATGCSREQRRFSDAQPGPRGSAPREAAARSPYDYNAYAISQGKALFDAYNCSGCHGHGGGNIGPALMDATWIYGDDPAAIFNSIVQGRPNGMPSFRGRIGDPEVWQLVAYVRALSGELSRDAVPGRDEHLFEKPSEQSTDFLGAVVSTAASQ